MFQRRDKSRGGHEDVSGRLITSSMLPFVQDKQEAQRYSLSKRTMHSKAFGQMRTGHGSLKEEKRQDRTPWRLQNRQLDEAERC